MCYLMRSNYSQLGKWNKASCRYPFHNYNRAWYVDQSTGLRCPSKINLQFSMLGLGSLQHKQNTQQTTCT